ncbi:regulatory protein, gntR family [Streptosporangium subroseum]|uniref:Regulatory protein, gntR family n=2 Tax=Streptosporangium subroseum TaxID=106412 RepID=A0A239P5M2_9ACTN|nr:regulatory protein, gntR family [Streptosporangium subroseum]
MSTGECWWLTGALIYPQLANRIRAQIAAGDYPAGSLLPSESALVQRFHVARTTVRRSLAVLEDEGLIVTLPGKGRVVKSADAQIQRSYRYQEIAVILRRQIQTGSFAVGTLLPSEQVLRRQHGASRNTVRHALAELEREGLIATEHGRGRFVRPLPD